MPTSTRIVGNAGRLPMRMAKVVECVANSFVVLAGEKKSSVLRLEDAADDRLDNQLMQALMGSGSPRLPLLPREKRAAARNRLSDSDSDDAS